MPHFIIKGMGRGFDGLLVETGDVIEDYSDTTETPNNKHEVLKITNRNEIFGDRNISFPITSEALWIGSQFLQPIENPATREYDDKNPWGKVLFEGRYSKGTLDIAYAQYERVLQVTVSEKENGRNRTLWAGYFTDNAAQARAEIEGHLAGEEDPDDLVFLLKQLRGED